MQYFIPTIILMALIWLRVIFINGLFADWNYYLDLYLLRLTNSTAHGANSNLLLYIKTKRLKSWKYYWRLDIWTVNKAVNDPFLEQEIQWEIQHKKM